MAKNDANYESGSFGIGNYAQKLRDTVGTKMEVTYAQATEGMTPEAQQDAKDGASAHLVAIQQDLAKTPAAEQEKLIADKTRLLKERAELQGRGLSGSERIVMAILGAAPMIAAATNAQSDPYAASRASGQIHQSMLTNVKEANALAVNGKDLELADNALQSQRSDKMAQRGQDRAWQVEDRNFKAANDIKVEGLRSSGKNSLTDPIKNDKLHRDLATAIIKSNPKGFENAKTALQTAEKLNAVANGEQQMGFNDIQMVYSFVQGLDNSVVRESDLKNFNAAKGILAEFRNKPNAVLNGEILGPEGRDALFTLQQIMAKTAAKTLNAAISPTQTEQWKKKFGDEVNPDYIKTLVVGNPTAYQANIMEQANASTEMDELEALRAKRGDAKK